MRQTSPLTIAGPVDTGVAPTGKLEVEWGYLSSGYSGEIAPIWGVGFRVSGFPNLGIPFWVSQ